MGATNTTFMPYPDSDMREDDESNTKSEAEVKKKTGAPDGGWGWMVVLGCALVHMLIAGAAASYGLIYQYLIERFEGSAALTASVHGVSGALRFGLGPVCSIAVNRFSVRTVVISGALLAGLGMILSAFPPNLHYMFLTWTVLIGGGTSFVIIPSIICVGLYFDKRRAIANGISTAGAGVGQFTFPLLFAFLQDNYGYFGAMIIFGGISFNLVVAGALFRPLVKEVVVEEEEGSLLPSTSDHSPILETDNCSKKQLSDNDCDVIVLPEHSECAETVIPREPSECDPKMVGTEINPNNDMGHEMSHRPANEQKYVDDMENDLGSNDESEKGLKSMEMSGKDLKDSDEIDLKRTDVSGNELNIAQVSTTDLESRHESAHELECTVASPPDEADFPFKGGKATEPDQSTAMERTSSTNSCQQLETDSSPCCSSCCNSPCCSGVKKYIDVKLLSDPSFMLFSMAISVTTSGYILVRTFLPALVESRGHPRSFSAQLLAYTGIADMTGRLLAGFFFDMKKIRPIRRYIYNCLPLAISVIVGMFTLSNCQGEFVSVVVLFGLFVGMFVAQRPSILADLVGTDRFSDALGLSMFFQGSGVLFGPSVGGALRDITGLYDSAYYFGSCVCAVGGVLFLCLNILHLSEQKKTTPVEDSNTDVNV